MIKKISPFLLLFAFLSIPSATAPAEEYFPPWQEHETPSGFEFGDMIDDHNNMRVIEANQLQSFLNIDHTKEFNSEGYTLAKHANCLESGCDQGWILHGKKAEATLGQKGPRLWLVDPTDIPPQPTFNHSQQLGQPAGEGTKAR